MMKEESWLEKEHGYYSWYEINVSKDGRHLFATAKRSLTNKEEMLDCLEIFKQKFPVEEGYGIRVTGRVEYGRELYLRDKERKW